MSELERDPLLTAVAEELRRPVALSRDFDARVMAAVRAARPEGRVRGAIRWLAEPRAVRVSPVGGLAAAAGLAGLILLSGQALESPAAGPGVVLRSVDAPSAPLTGPAEGATVQFVLAAPGANGVSLVGDFNDWDPSAMPLRPTADGAVWSVTVPLTPGRHEYAFVVDGTDWVPDPAAPPAPGADFGEPNSVVTVASSSL
jgi:hypothetical protein